MESNRKNKVAVVTGSGRGVGFACAQALVGRGIHVVMVGRSPKVNSAAKRLLSKGFKCAPFQADCSTEEGSSAVTEFCRKNYGRVDFLINNAGVPGVGKIRDLTVEDWDYVLKNNLTSAFLCSRDLLPLLLKRRGGAIVNVASVAARSYSLVAGVHYTASKAGMIGLTRQLAAETGPLGLRVNAVAPSQTKTEMLQKGLRRSGVSIRSLEEKNPMKTLASPKQVASVCAFLCTSEASYINGAVLDVNGGMI